MGRKVVVGGCDPAMFLAAEHIRKHDQDNLVPCLMGSSIAIGALKRGEVHVAGVHLADDRSGAWNLPYLERNLASMDCFVVTFAHWEEGLILRQGNPKKIRSVADLARSGVKIVNREIGSGARRLLDQQLETCGIQNAIGSKDTTMKSHPILKWHHGLEPGWPIPVSECGPPHRFAVSISFRCSASATTWSFPKCTTKRCKV